MNSLAPVPLLRQIGEWKWNHFENIIISNWYGIPDGISILVERSQLWVHYLKVKNGMLYRVSEPIQKSVQEINQEFKNHLQSIPNLNIRSQLQI